MLIIYRTLAKEMAGLRHPGATVITILPPIRREMGALLVTLLPFCLPSLSVCGVQFRAEHMYTMIYFKPSFDLRLDPILIPPSLSIPRIKLVPHRKPSAEMGVTVLISEARNALEVSLLKDYVRPAYPRHLPKVGLQHEEEGIPYPEASRNNCYVSFSDPGASADDPAKLNFHMVSRIEHVSKAFMVWGGDWRGREGQPGPRRFKAVHGGHMAWKNAPNS
ncbi:hypothetical protein C8F04DRAFT_1239725 [Mycena alexandri]|uniref:Uncharacterized protein n=1 Tax=Mycena alexandri TaxID=1745969 RepID=A0AAD6WT11_9AGAR|nr:hypothetical protein C8F04DRAFT_1239725 [Mycena alexandri]